MGAKVAGRVQKHRAGLCASGLRPVQIWVPDTRRTDFVDECRRQSKLVSLADKEDAAMLDFIENKLRLENHPSWG